MQRKAQAQPPASEQVDIEALLREADAADAAVRATLPTAEEERAIIAAAEALAGSEAGVPAKSRAVVERLVTKWLDFRPGEAWQRCPLAFQARCRRAKRRRRASSASRPENFWRFPGQIGRFP